MSMKLNRPVQWHSYQVKNLPCHVTFGVNDIFLGEQVDEGYLLGNESVDGYEK